MRGSLWRQSSEFRRFGGSAGEIHLFDETGENIVEKILIDGGIQYGQPQE
jgi:hypothetical protein